MRILQISSAVRYGGGEKHLCDLSGGLNDSGIEVDAVVRPGCEWKDRLVEAIGRTPLEAPLRNSADISSAFRIAAAARERECSVIHAHLARDYVAASVAARISGVPLVLTRHVLFPISFFTRRLVGNVSKVIAVSSGVAEELRKTFPAGKIATIPNGIEIRVIREEESESLAGEFRSTYGIPDEMRILVTLGELSPTKGQDDLLLAAAEVVREHPSAYFVLVGRDGSARASFKQKLRRLAKVSNLSDNVLFLDWVEDTRPLLSAAEVFVSSSRSESFGLAMLEAMAAGVPIAATRTAGAEELISDGDSGLLSAVGDPVGLAKNAARILSDRAFAEKLALSARSRAAERFTVERMVEATIRVYDAAAGDED